MSVIDLVLGILFGLDYERVSDRAAAASLDVTADTGKTQLLIAGQAAIGTLFSVVLRGYVLWLCNVVLVVFLFTQALLVSDYNRLAPFRRHENGVGMVGIGSGGLGGESNDGFVNDNADRKPHPIEAYGNKYVLAFIIFDHWV